MKRIYLDYNATTPISPAAVQAMTEMSANVWGNPSSLHAEGQAARSAVEQARTQVANLVGANKTEIAFTSGATESNNWAVAATVREGTLITSEVEHPSMLGAAEAATGDDRFANLHRLFVSRTGRLEPELVAAAMDSHDKVDLVSVMYVNNEIGNQYDIATMAAECRKRGVLFHTDATQAVGRIPVDFAELGVDLASFSAHKLYGPKGVGALYVRAGVNLPTWMVGGHQERARRAGTENLLGIVGFGAAAAAANDLDVQPELQASLRDYLERRLVSELGAVINGNPTSRVANTTNLSFAGAGAEQMLIALDLEGVSVSAGSACSAGSLEPSHVICALTDDAARRQGAIRFSVGRQTTIDDVEFAADRIVQCVGRLMR